jgi:4-amino-4-deoxy-L-arabinose transferase-like glycosyltransferase
MSRKLVYTVTMRLSQNRLRELLLLTGVCGFFFFFRLSAIGLLGPDEPRYAQVAREMLARHDWVTPVLYGHTWLEKPILLYWGEMLSYTAFGISDWAARIPSAVGATLLVFGTFLAVRRIRYAARLDAALMIASGVLILGFARAAATDMLLTAPFALSLLAWFCWYQAAYVTEDESRVAHICPHLANVGAGHAAEPSAPPTSRLWLILFYALNALAMLAKGPVAPALAALILSVFCAKQRNLRAFVRTLDPAGLAVFLAIAAPWYVLVQLRTPEFFHVFFLQHNLARFGSNLYRHNQPFWYYVPVALVATLPWTVWLIHGLADAIHALHTQLSSSPSHPNPVPLAITEPGSSNSTEAAANSTAEADGAAAAPSFTFEIFLFLWAAIPIVFFSLSRSKLPGYILPAIPPLLILAAIAVHRRAARDERPGWLAICIHSMLLAAIAAALVIAPRLAFKLPVSASSLMAAAFAGTAIFLIAALPLLTAGWPMLRFVTLLPLILAVGFLLRGLAPAIDATQSARPIARLLQQIERPGLASATGGPSVGPYLPGPLPLATFSLNRNTAFGLAFYLNRPIAPYEGLQISPAVYELPAAIPATAHVLVTREGSLPALSLLLPGRTIRFLGSYRPQRIEIFQVSPAP